MCGRFTRDFTWQQVREFSRMLDLVVPAEDPTPAWNIAPTDPPAFSRNPAAYVEGVPYTPSFDPAFFEDRITHPFLPFKPGAPRSASIAGHPTEECMEPRISTITLGVADFERSVRFYQHGLGLPRRESPPEIAFFTMGNSWLSLYAREALAEDAGVPADGHGFSGFTLGHTVRSREEVDRVLAAAVAAGAKLASPAQERFWGGYSGYFRDPDGYAWDIVWGPGPPDRMRRPYSIAPSRAWSAEHGLDGVGPPRGACRAGSPSRRAKRRRHRRPGSAGSPATPSKTRSPPQLGPHVTRGPPLAARARALLVCQRIMSSVSP